MSEETDRRTVKDRMEALGWRFDIDPDTCSMTPVKIVNGAIIAIAGWDFEEDHERCYAEARRDGALMKG